jgi:membrane-bound ClpP family serine protease
MVARGQDAQPVKDAAKSRGIVVKLPLPITGNVDAQVQKQIDHLLDSVPKEGPRPILILEFHPKSGTLGEGSQLGHAKSLARYLVSPKFKEVRTVAYVAKPIQGHALLPMLACEQIVMAPGATIGDAGRDEPSIDADVLSDYEYIANQRRTIPVTVVKALVDKRLKLLRIRTADGVQYINEGELQGVVETIKGDPGRPLTLGADKLREYGFVSHLADSRAELAVALGLPAQAVEEDPSIGRAWKPVVVKLDGPIRTDKVNFIIRSLEQRLASGDVNFVCIEIDSGGGSLYDSARLANKLADLNSGEVRTVAYVPQQARSDAALVAIACDHLVVTEGAIIGGPGEANLDPSQRDSVREMVAHLSEVRGRSWSLPLALVDREAVVHRYVHDGDNRVGYFTDDEHAQQQNPESWKKGSEVATSGGLTGRQADEHGLARFVVSSFNEVKQLYHFDAEPERLQANWAHVLIEQLARPEISGFLLFIAFFTLSLELMTPGIGLPGFISAVCFLLFFWANVLHGTAGALEIVLFAAGIAFVAIELFALPGFGAFGIGGIGLVIVSVILASQTFVIPRNVYQLNQFPRGLMMVTAAFAGVVISLAIFRKYLHKAPLVNRILLKPPEGELLNEMRSREALATFDHLLHKRGTTLTPLTPAGKARFGDQLVDVVSSGDFLPPGSDVYVVEAYGNRVVVKGIEG